MKTLLPLGFLMIAAHFLTAAWHLLLTTEVLPTMSLSQVWTAIGIFAVAHFSIALAWWLLPNRLAGMLLLVLFAVALAFGSYEHFLGDLPNNILRMPPGDGVTAFRLSSVLLFLLEATACWLGFRNARIPPQNQPLNDGART